MSSNDETPWIKASASQGQGECVEVRRKGDVVEVRDSKNPDAGIMRYTPREWSAFLNGAKQGEFDHLAM